MKLTDYHEIENLKYKFFRRSSEYISQLILNLHPTTEDFLHFLNLADVKLLDQYIRLAYFVK